MSITSLILATANTTVLHEHEERILKTVPAHRPPASEAAPRRVKIPVSVMVQMEEQLPIRGVHPRTIGANKKARCVIVDQLYRMLGSRHGRAAFNVQLAREIYTKTIADSASKFLQSCDGIDIAVNYSNSVTNPHGRVFILGCHLASSREPSLNDHDTYSPYMGSGIAGGNSDHSDGSCYETNIMDSDKTLVLLNESNFGVPGANFDRELKWCCDLCDFEFLPGWHHGADDRFHAACTKLYKGYYDWRNALQIGFAALEPLEQISLSECVELVRLKHPDIDDEAVMLKAESWHLSWEKLRKHGVDWAFRKSGRLYYAIAMLPKVLRKRLVFASGTTEIDLKSTYWALLAGRLQPGRCRDELIADLRSREFYSRVNRQLELPLPDSLVKSSVNRDGLFGVEDSLYSPYGGTDYYVALDRAYPELMRMIESMRRGPYGASDLAEKLMKSESAIFIDGGLQWCEQRGIPALPIHDCLMVPTIYAEVVLSKLQEIATQQLGYEPKFDVYSETSTANSVECV